MQEFSGCCIFDTACIKTVASRPRLLASFAGLPDIFHSDVRKPKWRIPKASNIQSVEISQAIHRAEK